MQFLKMENTKETDDWAKRSIEILKAKGYLEKTNRPMFMIGFAILIAGMIAGGCILYAVNNDAWKSNMNQTVSCPQAPACNCNFPSIPTCPAKGESLLSLSACLSVHHYILFCSS